MAGKAKTAKKSAKKAAPKMSLRDSLLATSTSAKNIVEVEIDGETYFLKKAKVSQRSKIIAGMNKCKTDDEKVIFMQVNALIAFAVDEDGEKLFTHADSDSIKNAEAGSPIDALSAKAIELLNLEERVKSQKKA